MDTAKNQPPLLPLLRLPLLWLPLLLQQPHLQLLLVLNPVERQITAHWTHYIVYLRNVLLRPPCRRRQQVAGKQCELMGAVTSIAVCPGNKGFFVGTSLANRCMPHVGSAPEAEGGTTLPPPPRDGMLLRGGNEENRRI